MRSTKKARQTVGIGGRSRVVVRNPGEGGGGAAQATRTPGVYTGRVPISWPRSVPDPVRIPLPPGERLLWYRISAVLGRGRSGFTYLTRDLTLDREVMIKEGLPEGIAARSEGSAVLAAGEEVRGAEALRSFIAAAQGVVIAKGPHLVAMLNAFEANGTAYAVMEREEGTDLAQLAFSGPLSARQLLAIAEGVLGRWNAYPS